MHPSNVWCVNYVGDVELRRGAHNPQVHAMVVVCLACTVHAMPYPRCVHMGEWGIACAKMGQKRLMETMTFSLRDRKFESDSAKSTQHYVTFGGKRS